MSWAAMPASVTSVAISRAVQIRANAWRPALELSATITIPPACLAISRLMPAEPSWCAVAPAGIRFADEKRRIADAAAQTVTEGMAVGLTGGTTATEVARALADRQRPTIVTNALNIASELGVRPNIKLIMTGGLARSQSYELSGPIAEAGLTGLNLDVAFIGVDGVDATVGCTTQDEAEAHTNAVMIRHTTRVVLVADSSKVGKVAFARICEAREVDELIADRAADAGAVRALTDAGVQVTLV